MRRIKKKIYSCYSPLTLIIIHANQHILAAGALQICARLGQFDKEKTPNDVPDSSSANAMVGIKARKIKIGRSITLGPLFGDRTGLTRMGPRESVLGGVRFFVHQ